MQNFVEIFDSAFYYILFAIDFLLIKSDFFIFSDLEKFCPNDTKHERRKNHYSKNENTASVDDIEQTQDGHNKSRTVGGINVYVHHGGDSATRTENFLKWRKMIQRKSNDNKESWTVSVVLTTYDLAIRDLALLRKQSFGLDR